MAIEFQNLTNVHTFDGSSRSGSIPTGFSVGDLLISVVGAYDWFTLSSGPISTPSGWTPIQDAYRAGSKYVRGAMSYRIAQAGDTSWTWYTPETVDTISVVILRYTGQSETSPIHSSGTSIGTGSPTAPSVGYTSVAYGSMILQTMGTWSNISAEPPQLNSRYLTNPSQWSGRAGGDKILFGGTGSTGTASWTGGAEYVGITAVINAAKTFIPTINIF